MGGMCRILLVLPLLAACQHTPTDSPPSTKPEQQRERADVGRQQTPTDSTPPAKPEQPLSRSDELPQEQGIPTGFRVVLLEEERPEGAKVLVRQHLALYGRASADDLRKLLRDRVREISGRVDQVAIYVYPSRAHYESGAAQWVAMSTWPVGDYRTNRHTEPDIDVNEDHLRAMDEKPVERFGLDDTRRKHILWELAEAEDRASRETGLDYDRYHELCEVYGRELARKSGLSYEQLAEIAWEGLQKNWPRPPYRGYDFSDQ